MNAVCFCKRFTVPYQTTLCHTPQGHFLAEVVRVLISALNFLKYVCMYVCKAGDVDDEKRNQFNLQLYWLRKEDKGIPEVPVDVDIPHEFLCPITHEIMHDPVRCSGNGNTFPSVRHD